MAQLLLSRHYADFHRPRRSLNLPAFRIGKYFLMFVMIIMAGVMSLLYLMHFTDVHTKGYMLRKLEIERERLNITQETKQMNIAKVKSLTHIQNSEAIRRMIPARNPIYLKSDSEVARR